MKVAFGWLNRIFLKLLFQPLQVPFHALSATTLRRYKKYFNLPHRSSTNTKQQVLKFKLIRTQLAIIIRFIIACLDA